MSKEEIHQNHQNERVDDPGISPEALGKKPKIQKEGEYPPDDGGLHPDDVSLERKEGGLIGHSED